MVPPLLPRRTGIREAGAEAGTGKDVDVDDDDNDDDVDEDKDEEHDLEARRLYVHRCANVYRMPYGSVSVSVHEQTPFDEHKLSRVLTLEDSTAWHWRVPRTCVMRVPARYTV